MDNYAIGYSVPVGDDGADFRIAEVLARLENHDYEEAYSLLNGELPTLLFLADGL